MSRGRRNPARKASSGAQSSSSTPGGLASRTHYRSLDINRSRYRRWPKLSAETRSHVEALLEVTSSSIVAGAPAQHRCPVQECMSQLTARAFHMLGRIRGPLQPKYLRGSLKLTTRQLKMNLTRQEETLQEVMERCELFEQEMQQLKKSVEKEQQALDRLSREAGNSKLANPHVRHLVESHEKMDLSSGNRDVVDVLSEMPWCADS